MIYCNGPELDSKHCLVAAWLHSTHKDPYTLEEDPYMLQLSFCTGEYQSVLIVCWVFLTQYAKLATSEGNRCLCGMNEDKTKINGCDADHYTKAAHRGWVGSCVCGCACGCQC